LDIKTFPELPAPNLLERIVWEKGFSVVEYDTAA
jgi:hypothetical protein